MEEGFESGEEDRKNKLEEVTLVIEQTPRSKGSSGTDGLVNYYRICSVVVRASEEGGLYEP